MRDSTKCKLCERSFRTLPSLLKHLETGHAEASKQDLEQYKVSLLTGGGADSARPSVVTAKEGGESSSEQEMEEDGGRPPQKEIPDNISALAAGKLIKFDKGYSYSLDKYMDPKRPFKCDVCKESFTQKNILLVHFNSVSHLHRMKKLLKEQQEAAASAAASLTPRSERGSPSSSPAANAAVPGTTLMSVLGSLSAKKQLEPDNELKPYKCNICKVAYAQSSTLDIHIRSVLHHTRATKLQELVISGAVDLSRPLIENPDMDAETAQAGLDLFSPKSLSSNSSLAKTPGSKEAESCSSPPTSSAARAPFTTSTPKSLTAVFEKVSDESSKEEFANLMSTINQTDAANPNAGDNTADEGKKSSHMLKSLLQNYGFELVMQFNESHQKRRAEQERRKKEQEEQEKDKEEESADKNTEASSEENESVPEMKKSKCPMCEKQFSSIWVLKAHTEEEHNVVVPQEFVQKYVNELKSNNKEEEGEVKDSPEENTAPDGDVIEIKENSVNDSAMDDIAAEETIVREETKKSPTAANSSPINNASGQHAELNPFQQAFKAFKEQEAKLMNNANLQNMNIHPPLIPGMMPKGFDPLAAIMAGNKEQPSQTSPFESQIFSKLGIDPDVVRQAGLDPKLLIHLAMVDPKSGMDPRMLAMFSTQNRELEMSNQKMMQLALESKFGAPPPPTHQLPPGFPPPGTGPADIYKLSPQTFDQGSRRARTRITDEQLKLLRANFDINNSPSEEQINSLSAKTSLPPKVIKHWFRNTLFKERQKNKDSPYNFNNPPSTMLNLEEYEKTGESKVIPLNPEERKQYSEENSKPDEITQAQPQHQQEKQQQQQGQIGPRNEKQQHNETGSEKSDLDDSGSSSVEIKKENSGADNARDEEMIKIDEFRKLQMSLALRVSVSPDNGNTNGKSFDGIFSPQMNIGDRHPLLQSPLPPGFPNPLGFLPGMPGGLGPNIFNGFGGFRNASPLGGGGGDPNGFNHSAAAKRANRTRFTDYQIKVLQEFFENNAYPKDDDLEYLSKLLGLSPRVIVVWFQNARQKARKIYENQPPIDSEEEGAGRFTRTPGLNYQCKKCLLVFQRYYELIRHQKQHCFKEEDAKRSALAQRAAAQAAAQFVGQANMGMATAAASVSGRSDSESGSALREQNLASPMSSNDEQHSGGFENNAAINPVVMSPLQKFMEENKSMGTIFEKRNQEDRVMKYLNEAQINLMSRYPANSHLAFLQKQGLPEHEPEQPGDDFLHSFNLKRKLSEEHDELIERDENGQPKDKRLRTTILPEQLDYLYQKYQLESNPSRKMLEQIAAEVGLRKRVVQVWFQNTRARERKGQFRAHQQVINKRCPYCPALFKVRSALESHLVTKHASQYARGEINIDNLPDAGLDDQQPPLNMAGRSKLFPSVPCPGDSPANMPPLIPNQDKSSEFEASMRKYYEETMKQFISDVKLSQQNSAIHPPSNIHEKNNEALDLSSPPLLPRHEDSSKQDPEDKNLPPSSPAAAAGSDSQFYEFDEDGMTMTTNYPLDSQAMLDGRKKFRTQISNTQVRIMKCIFEVYKMPAMSECLALAEFIGLQKRVVQVWFQNARAKEKKLRLHLQASGGGGGLADETALLDPEIPNECKFCKCQYENKFKVQEHLFDRKHLDNVRRAVEEGKYEPENPGSSLPHHHPHPSLPHLTLNHKGHQQHQQPGSLDMEPPGSNSNKPFTHVDNHPIDRPTLVNPSGGGGGGQVDTPSSSSSASQAATDPSAPQADNKQSNHFVNDQSVYSSQHQHQQHYNNQTITTAAPPPSSTASPSSADQQQQHNFNFQSSQQKFYEDQQQQGHHLAAAGGGAAVYHHHQHQQRQLPPPPPGYSGAGGSGSVAQDYQGYCHNQMSYPSAAGGASGAGYHPYPTQGYGPGYNQGYNNVMSGYPYQSGVPN